jgi:hypothetical protein
VGGGNDTNTASPQIKISALTLKQVQEGHNPSLSRKQRAKLLLLTPFKAFLDAYKK